MTELYIIWFETAKEEQINQAANFLQLGLAVYYGPDPNWPFGYKRLEQTLNQEQIQIVNQLCDQHVAINCVRGPYPPYSPTGR